MTRKTPLGINRKFEVAGAGSAVRDQRIAPIIRKMGTCRYCQYAVMCSPGQALRYSDMHKACAKRLMNRDLGGMREPSGDNSALPK